jgi:hypothetical protein
MTKDARDALLVGLFFVGYAIVLAIANRPSIQRVAMDINRLNFGKSRRDEMIAEEMKVSTDGT